jgi:quercetin dioxygenase-like cupin family protein
MITRRDLFKAVAAGSLILDPALIASIAMADDVTDDHTHDKQVPPPDRGVAVRQLMMEPLAGIDGQMGAVLLVEYSPGASSKPHRHPGHVFAYVLDGAVVSEVYPGQPIKYTKGQMWYEPPMHTHRISRNASESAPAKLVVFMIIEKGQPLIVGD